MAIAGNNGAQGGPSTATITTSYSSWSTKHAMTTGRTAQVVVGPGNLNVDPAFANAAGGDYRLTPGSPVIDHGDPAAAGPTLDLDGKARVVDGDGNGTAVRDMGAYELYVRRSAAGSVDDPGRRSCRPRLASDTVAPGTKFTSKPAKVVTKATVKFRFRSNESGVTFKCKLDKRRVASVHLPEEVEGQGRQAPLLRARDRRGRQHRCHARDLPVQACRAS